MEWTSSLVYRCERKKLLSSNIHSSGTRIMAASNPNLDSETALRGSVLQDQSDISANSRRMRRAPPALQLRDNYQHLIGRKGLFMFEGPTAMTTARERQKLRPGADPESKTQRAWESRLPVTHWNGSFV